MTRFSSQTNSVFGSSNHTAEIAPAPTYSYTIKQAPVKCPVCNGTGSVPQGFYAGIDPVFLSQPTTAHIVQEGCRTCNGRGIVY